MDTNALLTTALHREKRPRAGHGEAPQGGQGGVSHQEAAPRPRPAIWGETVAFRRISSKGDDDEAAL